MLPERTTTTGDSLPVKTINPFHMINAEVTIIPAKRNTRKLKPPHETHVAINSQISNCRKPELLSTALLTDTRTTLPLLNITILQT
jgi:hypothetical protein